MYRCTYIFLYSLFNEFTFQIFIVRIMKIVFELTLSVASISTRQPSTTKTVFPFSMAMPYCKGSFQKDVFKYMQHFLNPAVMNDIAEHIAYSTLLIKPVSDSLPYPCVSLTQAENNLLKQRRVKLTTIMSFLYNISPNFPHQAAVGCILQDKTALQKQCITPFNNMLKGIQSCLFHFFLTVTKTPLFNLTAKIKRKSCRQKTAKLLKA